MRGGEGVDVTLHSMDREIHKMKQEIKILCKLFV